MSKILYLPIYTLSQKDATLHLCITMAYIDRFSNYLTAEFSKEFAIKPLSCFPSYLTYVATLPCKILKNIFAIFPLQLLQKDTLKFIIFLVNVIHII